VATSLLTTKLNIPPARPQTVQRPRLIDRLKESPSYSLILISAPAGFGKTTIISEWIHSSSPSIPTTWLSLEEGENDPVRFWDYFIAALKILNPAIGKTTLSLLHAPEPYPTESLLTALINDLTSIQQTFVLVLDDYHLIKSKSIHEGVAYLLEHMPLQMHIFIATRADPPLPLAHFRGKGRLLEIRADDLRFSQQETTNLFAAMDIPPLSDESINVLNTKTEGWVVGLKMAALSMQQEKDIPKFIVDFTGSQRYIMNYLVEEILQKQTAEICDFLLKTSVLERLSAPLCDHVTGNGGSRETLTRLEQANLFIVVLDESGEWYRYHHLFAELLRHQLEVTSGAEEAALLQQRASRWCEDHAFHDDAVRYSLACRDWETAIRLIFTRSEYLLWRGENNTLINWLQVIPDELLRTHHWLYCQYACALVNTDQLKPVEAALNYLERTAQEDSGLQGAIAFSRTILARKMGDIPLAIKMAEKSLTLLPPDNLKARTMVSFWLGFVRYQNGLIEEAMPLLRDTYEMGRQMGEEDLYGAFAAAYLGAALWTQGKLREALVMVQKAVDQAGQPMAAALSRSILATLLYDRNDLEGSARYAQQSIEFGELVGEPMVLLDSNFWLARTRLAQGEITGAKAAMEKMDQAAHLTGVAPDFQAYHAAWHVMFAIRQDDLTTAIDWGNHLQDYADVLPFDASYVPARLLIAQGEKTLAAEQLQSLHKKAVQAGAHGLAIWFRVYHALAADTVESALEFLAEALKIAEPEGYIRTFVDEGKLLKPLLEKALSRGTTPEYVRKLLTIIEAEERQKLKKKKGEETHSRYGSLLSGRELEVLKLMAEGLSNQQIADRLVISLSTAKNHVHNIIEKLNAKGRTQAIAQARELELM
jgi:LuxR family maltose regulon positive regulatory protein